MKYYDTSSQKVSRQLSQQLVVAVLALFALIGLMVAQPNATVFILANIAGTLIFGCIAFLILKG